jgi:ParB/RepB/Spo0J family partition protein
MNAPVTAAALSKPTQLQVLAIASLVPSKTHIQAMRRKRFDSKALDELAQSIKKVGILQPPVARPIDGGKKFEIVAGERRFIAAGRAGLKEIQVNVAALNDDDVLEVQLIENLQREGLHELEEAEGYEELMKLKKIDADQVADLVGKSRSYVYARKKLLALCPEARQAFYSGELDASRALLIARIGHHDTQRQALADITKGPQWHGGQRPGEAMSYRAAHQHILKTFMLKLSTAPFDLKDAALLPKAGACGPCPKRTGNQADLFGDVKHADVCSDPKCFDDKRQAHHAIARKALEAKGEKVISGAEAKKLMPHWENGNDYVAGGFVKLTDSDYVGGRYQKIADVLGPDYKPTLIQHPQSGEFVKVAPRSTVAAAAAKKKSKTTKKGKPAAQAPRVTDHDVKDMVAQRVIKQLAEKVKGAITREDLAHLADQTRDHASGEHVFALLKVNYGTKLEKLPEKDLGRLIVLLLVEDGIGDQYSGNEQYAAAVCKRHKVDPKKIELEVRAELKKKADEDKAKAAATAKPKAKASAPAKKPAGKAKGKKK